MKNKSLEYFLEANSYFKFNLFSIINDTFMGDCIKDNKKYYSYMTDVSINLFRAYKENNGFYSILKKSNATIYFTKNYSDIQLTSIFLCIILARSKEEIAFVANKNYKDYCNLVTYNLLCGKKLSEIKKFFYSEKSASKRKMKLMQTVYYDNYYIFEKMQKTEYFLKEPPIAIANYSEERNCLLDDNCNEYRFIL